MEFADIALAKLLQTMPELGNLVLNFQDVSEELESRGETDVRVGVFILRAGEEFYFVPVVSKNDNVYPIDSVFFQSKGKFFPLTKKTVSLILSSNQLSQGNPTKIPTNIIQNPSVFELINPPRTGKYVYASASKMTDFLAQLPSHLKENLFEKVAAEKSMYEELDKMFGLKAILDVLRGPNQGAAAKTNVEPISVVTSGDASNIAPDLVPEVIRNGYAIQGKVPGVRVAVSAQDFNRNGIFRQISQVDGDRDYEIMFRSGESRQAFLPKLTCTNGTRNSLAIFTNGDYALSDGFISVGEDHDRKEVLTVLFNYNPPKLLKEIYMDDTIVLFDNFHNSFIGPFNVTKVVFSNMGVELNVAPLGGVSSTIRNICAFTNFRKDGPDLFGGTLYVPSNTICLKLGKNVTYDLEQSVNNAQKRREITQTQFLGDELNLGFDGVEFAINGQPIGPEPKVVEVLVVKEGIDPTAAQSFIKQAKETKFTKIYLTKKAYSTDVGPAEIPQYGAVPPQSGQIGLNGSFVPNVQESMHLGDSQVTEATVISELLQVPDMYELIDEYLPDIEEAIDKLGRILFMSRVHINSLSEGNDADEVFAFLASLKSIYRLLGDNFLKLQEVSTLSNLSNNEMSRDAVRK